MRVEGLTKGRREELKRFLVAHGVPLGRIPADTPVRTDGRRVFLEQYRMSEGRHVVDGDGYLLRDELVVEAISPVLIPSWIGD